MTSGQCKIKAGAAGGLRLFALMLPASSSSASGAVRRRWPSVVLLLLLPAAAAIGQQAFEAASVKPNKAGNFNSSFNTRRDNVEAKNVALWDLVVDAFEIKDYQLIAPDWLKSERFDILAKAPQGTGDDKKLMPLLKTLLNERFKLQTHTEQRELPCFALLVSKGGLKLGQAETGSTSMSHHSDDNGGRLTAKHVDMEEIAEWLSREVERPVLDMTGLKGAYDFTLNYSKESAKGISDSAEFPIVTQAIQQQLGLRLERRTAPIPVVIIDHIERVPVEN